MTPNRAKQIADAVWRSGALCIECPHKRTRQAVERTAVRLVAHCGVRDDRDCPGVRAWEGGR